MTKPRCFICESGVQPEIVCLACSKRTLDLKEHAEQFARMWYNQIHRGGCSAKTLACLLEEKLTDVTFLARKDEKRRLIEAFSRLMIGDSK